MISLCFRVGLEFVRWDWFYRLENVEGGVDWYVVVRGEG